MKLYHATYEALIPSIEKSGLGGASSGYEWEDSKKGVVYLATDSDVAISYAESNDDVPEEWLDSIVVFVVDSDDLDEDRLVVDQNVQDNDGSTYEYHGVIPFSLLKEIDEVDESHMKEYLMELMENPETLWKVKVGIVEDPDEDDIKVDETLTALEKEGIVKNVKRNVDSEEIVSYTFNCLDPYTFEDVVGMPINEYAEPVNEMTEDVDWDNVSTKMSDYRKI